MEAALRWQKLINLLSGFACIDDAERLILLSQFHGKFCISHVAAVAECHTAEAVIESYSIGTNLLYFYLRAERANQIVQYRLGGGTQHGSYVEMRHKIGNCSHAGQQVSRREHLRLVKNYHAICDIMKLSALGRFIGIERFKKLYCSCNDNRSVPVLRSQLP